MKYSEMITAKQNKLYTFQLTAFSLSLSLSLSPGGCLQPATTARVSEAGELLLCAAGDWLDAGQVVSYNGAEEQGP